MMLFGALPDGYFPQNNGTVNPDPERPLISPIMLRPLHDAATKSFAAITMVQGSLNSKGVALPLPDGNRSF